MRSEATTNVACDVCGSPELRVLIRKDGHDILECRRCGLAFTFPQPECIVDQYDPDYFELYHRRRQFRLKRAAARLTQIELMLGRGRLLDIGCSLGYFIEAARERGWDAMGVEVSSYAAQEARSRGLDVRTGQLQDAGFPDAAFDCVTMWDVLEHVPEPTSHMREVRRILKEGGLVVIGTPDIGHPAFLLKREKWRHLKPTEHLFYYRRCSIRRLLEKTGFQPIFGPGLAGRYTQLNDVMTVYGVADAVQASTV